MSKLLKDIVVDSLSEAYVNDSIIGVDQYYYKDINALFSEILPYLDDSKQSIEISETECKEILSKYVKEIQAKAFIDGISIGYRLNNLKL